MEAIQVNEQGVMKRPTVADGCVRRRTVELAIADVRQWGWDEEDVSTDVLTGLFLEALRPNGTIDKAVTGFDEPDEDDDDDYWNWRFVLKPHHVSQACEELVKEWVRCLGVTLSIPIGAVVTCDLKREVRGTVEKLLPLTAEYGIATPGLEPGQYHRCAAELVALDRVDVDA